MEGFVLLSGCRDVFCPGASEPRNMAYMNRLGIWGEGTPFREFSNFIQAVERRYINPEPFGLISIRIRNHYIATQRMYYRITVTSLHRPLFSSVRLLCTLREYSP